MAQVNNQLRPPTPEMQAGELHQWRVRMYEALQLLQRAIDVVGGKLEVDHNNLINNGGVDSHAIINSHLTASIAHGASSRLIGETEVITLISDAIAALSGLKHGIEVDNPTAAHGVTEIVGTVEPQTLTNKIIDANSNVISNLQHGVEVDNPTAAHGVAEVAGVNEVQTLTNKTITAADNSISGLRHGLEVDNPLTGAHGVIGEFVGTLNFQTLFNKTIVPSLSVVSADYELGLGEELVTVDTAGVTLTLTEPQQQPGIRVVIENNSGGDIYVISEGAEGAYNIQGEPIQTVPADCTMVVMATTTEWRIV